jgi:hypothetical protein
VYTFDGFILKHHFSKNRKLQNTFQVFAFALFSANLASPSGASVQSGPELFEALVDTLYGGVYSLFQAAVCPAFTVRFVFPYIVSLYKGAIVCLHALVQEVLNFQLNLFIEGV